MAHNDAFQPGKIFPANQFFIGLCIFRENQYAVFLIFHEKFGLSPVRLKGLLIYRTDILFIKISRVGYKKPGLFHGTFD
jgi:hypothetical protein